MKEITRRLAEELNLPQDVVLKSYKAYWKFIRHTIEELPLKEDMDEGAFDKLRPNFNIPNLGKLVCPYDRYIGQKKKNQLIKDRYVEHKEDKANG